jgi:limonene-1,2-epoxide hydrolase
VNEVSEKSAVSAADVERVNRELAVTFNEAWSGKDCDTLMTLLSDDVAYMVYEGGPVHQGPAAVEQAVRPFMARFGQIRFRILRLEVMGPIVIHERTEHYYAPDGELDTRFHVIGMLVIKDDRIIIWRDYSMPGAEQLVGPLCTQK